MAEAGWAAYLATAVSLAVVTAIQFAERAYRHKRLAANKTVGTYGYTYETSATSKEKDV